MQQYEGGYLDYIRARQERQKQNPSKESALAVKKSGAKDNNADNGKEKPNYSQKKLKFSYKEQREYETIDDDIALLEEKVEQLDQEIIKNVTNSVKLRELMEEKETAEAQLEEKMERWVYLNDLAEQIEAQK